MPNIFAADFLTSFVRTQNLLDLTASQGSVIFNEKIYVFGGANSNVLSSAWYSTVLLDGLLNPWASMPISSPQIFWHSAVIQNSLVYLLGGSELSSGSQNTVYLGKIQNDGLVGSWDEISVLPKRLSLGGVVVSGDKIYFAGGFTDSQGNPSANVYYSTINADGTIGTWQETSAFPNPRYGLELITYNGFMYAVGDGSSSDVLMSQINPDGSLGPWSTTSPLPQVVSRASIAKADTTIYVIGGNPGASDNIYYSDINPDGTLTTWQESATSFPRANCCSPAVEVGGRIYVMGGHDGSNYYNDVWVSNKLFEPTPIPTISPTTTPPLSPTPTPLPEVDTIAFVPGMGASWNADALLNCKDDGYSGSWTLAPFAKEVYRPLLENLKNLGRVEEFYYDWRKDVRVNGERLADFLDTKLQTGEKSHLFGHSMGGLVSRAYLEAGGGDVVRMFTAGTPHYGSALAYPTWSGGELWEGDLLTNIGKTIALRRCGLTGGDRMIVEEHFPAFQNLLPTFNFLRDKQSNLLKPVTSMLDRNNWLPTSFDPVNLGVEMGTLSGTGKRTLSEIVVKEPSRRDVRSGNWEDGKPAGRKHTVDGDGAVLLSSSQWPGVENRIMAGSHNGMLSDPLGIEMIMNFLRPGTSLAVSVTAKFEPESAIVVVGEAEIKMGSETSDGVAVTYNPNRQRYSMRIRPKKEQSILGVGQFFADGRILWKDYRFLGKGERIRVLDFDPNGVNSDILR